MQLVFSFEQRAGKPLATMPMVVRFKLDICGIKLPLRDWARLSQERKWQLVRSSCATTEEQAAYRMTLAEFIDDSIVNQNPGSEVDGDVISARRMEIPPSVIMQFAKCSLPNLGASRWMALSDLQRFALIKHSREGHKNAHFLSAVEEFGLLQSSAGA